MAYLRMRGSVQRVEIYDTRVDAWWNERGPVGRLTTNIARRGRKAAKAAAPVRTGNMRNNIKGWSARRGKRHRVSNVGTNTYYAQYVIEGTSDQYGERHLRGSPGPARNSAGMWGRGRPMGTMSPWPRMSKRGVKGQAANDFLYGPATRAAELYLRGG